MSRAQQLRDVKERLLELVAEVDSILAEDGGPAVRRESESERLLELGTVARMLQMTQQGACKAIKREGVGQKICGRWMVARSDVERLMRSEQAKF